MSAHKRKAHAVLMGDIVGSEIAPAVLVMHQAFNRALSAANKRHAATIASPLTVTLGDEFQGLLTGLASAWDIAADLRFKLLAEGVSCRFVIGLVLLETPLNRTRAWNMMGAGFSAARDKLNDKRLGNAYRFSLQDHPMLAPLLDAVGESITQVESDWTATQLAYFVAARASNRSNAKLAEGLGVSERALYKVLHAARADFHRRQSQVLRRTLVSLDQEYGLT